MVIELPHLTAAERALLDKIHRSMAAPPYNEMLALLRSLSEARAALLLRIQRENNCPGVDGAGFPYDRCNGFYAEKCGCAAEARAALKETT